MKRVILYSFLFFCSVVIVVACQKWKDKAPGSDSRLTHPYCNDPLAVNYNWGFPGRPDDSVCYYPTDVFKGVYIFNDTVRLSDNTFSYAQTDTLHFYALTQTKLGIMGFCSGGDTLKLTVDRILKPTIDTVVGFGQVLCSGLDTVNGNISQYFSDTTGKTITITFTANTPSGILLHSGYAIKQ